MADAEDTRSQPGAAREEGPRHDAAAELFDRLVVLLQEHDREAAVRTAVEAVTSGVIGIPELYRDVLSPLLSRSGEAWQHGRVRIWEEHFSSAVVRTIVEILYPGVLKVKASVPPAGRSVLLACPPEENHDLGLRMVADRFDMAGWTTYFLGADTPTSDLIDAAQRLSVDAVVLSSSTHFHRVALRRHVDLLKHALGSLHVWVGGPAFRHGGDGWTEAEIVDLDGLLADAGTHAGEHVERGARGHDAGEYSGEER
ncbi:MAG: cobalamin-dependent protein [Actinomycetes bacterium]